MLFENKWTYISPFINDPNLNQNNPLILNIFICICFGFSIGVVILSIYRLYNIFKSDNSTKEQNANGTTRISIKAGTILNDTI